MIAQDAVKKCLEIVPKAHDFSKTLRIDTATNQYASQI